MKTLWLCMCICCLGLLACREQGIQDIDAPTITIQSPTAQTIFQSGADIPLAILIEENDQLHEYQMVVRTEKDQSPVFNFHDHSHAQQLQINQSFSLVVRKATPLVLEVVAIDHHGNQSQQSLRFQVVP